MKSWGGLVNDEKFNAFLTFCRHFDDLGSFTKLQVIGQHAVSIINSFLIAFQIITNLVIINERSNGEELTKWLYYYRDFVGNTFQIQPNSIFSQISTITFVVIFTMSLISIVIRINQRKTKTVLAIPTLIYITFFNTISPIFLTITVIGFFSSVFHFIVFKTTNVILVTILSALSAPSIIFAVSKLLTDSRMENLVYVSPNFKLSLNLFYLYTAFIVGMLYIEYSDEELSTTMFVCIVLFIYGLFVLIWTFRFPAYQSAWHSFLAIAIVYICTVCIMVVCTARYYLEETSESLKKVWIAMGVGLPLALLHTYVSRLWVKRKLNHLARVDPNNYISSRICGFLVVADIHNDQDKFPANFPEKLMEKYPENYSLIVYAILFKLFDPTAHKELLKFSEKLTFFNTTNGYLSSMLRSILFVAHGNSTEKGDAISHTLLNMSYYEHEHFWYYVIQDNKNMAGSALFNLSVLIPRSKPFLQRHDSIIGGYKAFLNNVFLESTGKRNLEGFLDDNEEEDHNYDKKMMADDCYDINDSYYHARLENISKHFPPRYKNIRNMFIGMQVLILLVCISCYLWISHNNSMARFKRSAVKDQYAIYANFLSAYDMLAYLYKEQDISPEFIDSAVFSINSSIESITLVSSVAKNKTFLDIINSAREKILSTAQNQEYITDTNIIIGLFNVICEKGVEIYNFYANNKITLRNALLYCMIGIIITCIAFIILFLVANNQYSKFHKEMASQMMYFNKVFCSIVHQKYADMLLTNTNVYTPPNKYKKVMWKFFVICLFPFVICAVYCPSLNNINYNYIDFTTFSLYLSQVLPIIADSDLLFPQLIDSTDNQTAVNVLNTIKSIYSILTSIISSLYSNKLSYTFSDDYNFSVITNLTIIGDEKIKMSFSNIKEDVLINFFNASTILLRDYYILTKENMSSPTYSYVAEIALYSALACTMPILDLLDELNRSMDIKAEAILFTFITAPVVFLFAIIMMITYGIIMVKRLDTELNLIRKMICLPRYDNPFFNSDDEFLGYKDPLECMTNDLYNHLPVPVFEATTEHKIIDENETAYHLFGDVIGTLCNRLPSKIVDQNGDRHYFNYTFYEKKSLLGRNKLNAGKTVIISNDMTSLFMKRELLKNLTKDIKLTYSIPPILQREKPTHIQGVSIVNFCFSERVTNDQFLAYTSKIEDFFSQFVSFFMFEKLRFSFYVSFYDANASRQASRDAINFAQLARYEAENKKVDVKIAVSMEDEVTAIAQKTDMIWSVTFLNALLWRTDQMFRHIDYGKIVVLAKMSPGMHYSRNIQMGRLNENVDVMII